MVTPSPRPTALLRMRSIRTSQEFWGHTQPTSCPQTWRASLTEVLDFQDLGRFSAVCMRMAALTNGFASFEGETRRPLPREASTDSVFSAALPHVPELEVAKHSHPLLGKNGAVVHSKSTAPAASSSLENRSGAARECLGTKIIFWIIIIMMLWKFYLLLTAYQGGKKVLGCGSNVVDHIYNVKGKLNERLGDCRACIHKRIWIV